MLWRCSTRHNSRLYNWMVSYRGRYDRMLPTYPVRVLGRTMDPRQIKEGIMLRKFLSLGIALLAAALAACSDGTGGSTAGGDTSGARGSLIFNPPLRVATLTAVDLAAQLNAQGATGQQLLALATAGPTPPFTPGAFPCGVDVHYIQYGTVDGGSTPAPTSASGALMVPTGPAGACSGPRPILLYAHGTATDRATNLADVTNPNNTEGVLIAAMFAAYGFIVVAPNYAGYDSSPLQYHPFLNGTQQSSEMIDALTAARKALGNIPASTTTDGHVLFVTGYSQGGYVAMATAKALEAAADPTFVASAPMSGPYALEAFGDFIFFGGVNLGSTVFAPMIATSYQRQFGNIYTSPNDPSNIFTAQYAPTIDALLPSNTPLATLIQQGKLPQLALFSSTPPSGTGNAGIDAFLAGTTPPPAGGPISAQQAALFALGFGAGNLIQNTARAGYVVDTFGSSDGAIIPPTLSQTAGRPLATNPQNPLRQALKANDMRTWTPAHHMLLCGGQNDPTVFFPTNTETMAGK